MLAHLLVRLWLLFTQPISVDAASTFTYFTSAGFETAVSYYPAPNNHVLHTICTLLFYHPGPYQTYLLRIPAFVFGGASLLLFYHISRRHFGSRASLIALALFGAVEPVVYFSYVARGYSMLLFFSLAAVYFWQKNHGFSRWWPAILYSLMLALGIYTVPSHLYFVFAFSTGLVLLYSGKPGFWKSSLRLLGLDIAAVALAILAYKPIIDNHGIGALINNNYVKAKTWLSFQEWYAYFLDMGGYFLVARWGMFALGIVALGAIIFKKYFSPLGLVSAVLCLWIFVIPILHRTLAFHRVWVFTVPFMFWMLLDIFKLVVKKDHRLGRQASGLFLVAVLLVAAAWEYHSVKGIIAFERGSRSFKQLAEKLISKRYSPVCLQDFYALTFLPYHYANSEFRNEVEVSIQGSSDLDAADWQRLCSEFQVVVLNPAFSGDSIVGECVVDTSWTNVLLTPESCRCLEQKLRD